MARVVCDLVLVTWNKLEYTKPCVESLLRHTRVPYRLIIVDNGSGPDTVAFLDELVQQHPDRVVTIRHADNLGWTRAVNAGLRRSEAPYVCLLNNDLLVTPGWLERMIEVAESDRRIGLVNPTYNAHGESRDAFLRRSQDPRRDGSLYSELNECNGACLLIRRDVLASIGGLDDVFGFGGMDDLDYSRRAQVKGFRSARAHAAYVFHWENVSINDVPNYWSEFRRRNVELAAARWGECRRVALVLAGMDEAASVRYARQGLAVARVGIRVHVWALLGRSSRLRDPRRRWAAGLVEHNNLRWVIWDAQSFAPGRAVGLPLAATIQAASRRCKAAHQRIRAFIAPAAFVRGGLERLRWLHGSPVYRAFDECPLIEREVRWARSLDERGWQDS